MRKFAVMAAALMLAGSAYAQNGARQAGRDARAAPERAAERTQHGAERAGERMEQGAERAGERMEQGAQRAEERGHTVGDQMAVPGQQRERGGAVQAQGQERRDRNEMMKKDSFDLEGKVASVSKNKITITREDAPRAELHVDKNTQIELDGERATLSQLRQGQDVQASFNLQGDKPMAVEIKAEKKN